MYDSMVSKQATHNGNNNGRWKDIRDMALMYKCKCKCRPAVILELADLQSTF